MHNALSFVNSFEGPFRIRSLDKNKKKLEEFQCLPKNQLIQILPQLITRSRNASGHLFVRPAGEDIFFLDADNLDDKHESDVFALQPVAVVQTSEKSKQIWYRVPKARDRSEIQKRLQVKFNTDPNSLYCDQDGRLPGSLNCKRSKPFEVITQYSSSNAELSESHYLQITRGVVPSVKIQPDGSLTVRSAATGRSGKVATARSGKVDRSMEDWDACVSFFKNTSGNVDDAIKLIKWKKQKTTAAALEKYARLTATKAQAHVTASMSTSKKRQRLPSPGPTASDDDDEDSEAPNASDGDDLSSLTTLVQGLASEFSEIKELIAILKDPEAPVKAPVKPRAGVPVIKNDAKFNKSSRTAVCVQCGIRKGSKLYSDTQWKKRPNQRCEVCCKTNVMNGKCRIVFFCSFDLFI